MTSTTHFSFRGCVLDKSFVTINMPVSGGVDVIFLRNSSRELVPICYSNSIRPLLLAAGKLSEYGQPSACFDTAISKNADEEFRELLDMARTLPAVDMAAIDGCVLVDGYPKWYYAKAFLSGFTGSSNSDKAAAARLLLNELE